uniref:Dephospho-CoA kinase domain containing n=1 Tax=Sus scrofa TaxID=9823 RepID=A0A8D1KD12_PIG
MFLVGLTGGIASGKSSVLQVLQQLGCAVIDVDVIARHGEWGARVVHSSSLVLPFFRWASPFYKAFQGLRGGEGFPSAPGWSRVPAPAAPPSFPLQTTLGIPCTLPSTAAFPPLLVILLQTKEAPMGSRIIVPVVTQSPRAGLEAPESDRAPPYATVVQPGYPAHRRIVEAFGTEVLLENGDIDRKALGDLIFNQPDRRHLLNAITHPEICREMTKETFKYFLRGYRYVILDVPLLFETKKLLKYMKHTVVVYCDRDTQLARLMQRNNLKQEDAEARIKAQLPLEDKARMARHVLDNSGEWSVTKRQVVLLHAELERSLEYLPLRLGVLAGLAGIVSLLYLLTHYLLASL